jgi:pentatricopeptide repeat protein
MSYVKEGNVKDAFSIFAKMVARSFQDLVKEPDAFVVDVDGDAMYQQYLAAFPEGTNPIFRKNTEHDCSCCRQFIRRAGSVVAIREGKLNTIWDRAAEEAPAPYDVVAASLRDKVQAANVSDLFRVGQNETSFGAVQTRSLDKETQKAITWNHLHTGEIPRNYRAASPDQVRGDYRTTAQVFERGLIELTPDAVETVIGLVMANNLYRGEEHKSALVQFQKVQREYLAKSEGRERNLFVWANAGNPAARFRNTVIGTLVQDLSEGKELEHAVKSFETKVAPTNYKRTTALITPGMVKKAMETIEALGLEPALERRFAVISDISVNDVKWVDGAVKPLMKGGIGDVLLQHTSAKSKSASKGEERAEDISLDDFMASVLPQVTSLELLFKNELVGNLMSLTAPVHPEPRQLFKWSNDFAWSYGGNVADSIRDRVKKAGGKVDGAMLRVSLSWFNFDDLDLHIYEPKGSLIYFGNKRGWTGGTLDVDMNAGSGTTREAVENIVWSKKPTDGAYRVVVNNYSQRETSDPGFVVEMESAGKLTHFTYNKAVRNRLSIEVATLHVKDGVVERIEVGDPGITTGAVTQEKWGLKTGQFVKVSAVTFSPNYWGDNAIGNKHTFFVIEGAKNDEPTRGFYNEFLNSRLEPHRKVFEVIGDKTKCRPVDGQLSGLGFSSTKKETFIVRAQQGKKKRVFNVHVGAEVAQERAI